MEPLQIIHDIESRLGRDVTDEEFRGICDYLRDDPMSTEPEYLIELFSLET